MKRVLALALAIGLAGSLGSGVRAEQSTYVLGGDGVGQVRTAGGAPPGSCAGAIQMPFDGGYENGYAWGGSGVAPPNYGAFAQRFATNGTGGCGVAFDLTATQHLARPMDVYVWGDVAGLPGQVIAVVPRVDVGEVAIWPEVSRHTVDLPQFYDDVWVGFWGDWPGEDPAWFVAADTDGPRRMSAMTNVAPGVGLPSGWQDVSAVFGPTQSLGIGAISPDDPSNVGDGIPARILTPEIEVSRTVLNRGSDVRFSLSLPHSGAVMLGVYALSGREVVRLIDGHMEAGRQSVVWAPGGRSALPSGVYWARLTTAEGHVSRRLIVVQ